MVGSIKSTRDKKCFIQILSLATRRWQSCDWLEVCKWSSGKAEEFSTELGAERECQEMFLRLGQVIELNIPGGGSFNQSMVFSPRGKKKKKTGRQQETKYFCHSSNNYRVGSDDFFFPKTSIFFNWKENRVAQFSPAQKTPKCVTCSKAKSYGVNLGLVEF